MALQEIQNDRANQLKADMRRRSGRLPQRSSPRAGKVYDLTGKEVAPNAEGPKVGERKQFKQGWGVWNGSAWVPEAPEPRKPDESADAYVKRIGM